MVKQKSGTAKPENRRRVGRRTRMLALLLSVGSILSIAVGGTAAYLMKDTEPVENTFRTSEVSCQVNESFDGATKSNVTIRNTGNVDAYIRAYVTINWVDSDGAYTNSHNHTGLPGMNGASGWSQDGSGCYVYSQKVAPGASTSNLIGAMTLPTAEDGCRAQVEIVASAIQAEGVNGSGYKAVQEAWGYDLGQN